MLLNGTIRRKTCINLLLVLGMLITLSVGALSGLSSYRRLVRELNYSIYEAPRRADVAEALGALFEPLLHDFPPTLDGSDALRRTFEERLNATRRRIVDFHRRLDQLSPEDISAAQRQQTEQILATIETGLNELESQVYLLAEPPRREEARRRMLQEIARLETQAQRIPEGQSHLHESLAEAREIYRSHIRLVVITTVVGLIFFAGFGYYIYAGILVPLRKLHQGALRVAEGDFHFRLEIPQRGELTELANAFNRMTKRFQESQQDLNRQVSERGRQLLRSERLAGIGFLAAGVAHEINNPLSAIAMAAESLSRHMTSGQVTGRQAGKEEAPSSSASPTSVATSPSPRDVVQTYLAMIQREAQRCQKITRRLLDFARGDDGSRTRVDLTQLVREVLEMVRPISRYQNRNIEFFRTEPCFAEVNGPEIKQVVLNIVSNALESMEDGGTLRIRLLEQTDTVEMVFTDDGCGMSEEVLAHLFEPFFTSRKDGRGTGLGMALSQQIVLNHNGTLDAQSEGPGMGSTFRLVLPRRAAESRQQAA